jgi:hypothetical protein
MFFGNLILLIGIIFLLKNLGVIHGNFWGWFISFALILIGLSMILRQFRKQKKN